MAVALGLMAWIGLVVRQVVECGFYSDDWGIQYYYWSSGGYTGAVSTLVDVLGSKPLLAVALPAPYAILGTDPRSSPSACGCSHRSVACALTHRCTWARSEAAGSAGCAPMPNRSGA